MSYETVQWRETAYNLFPITLSSCKQLQLLRNYCNCFFLLSIIRKRMWFSLGEQFYSPVFLQRRIPACLLCAWFWVSFAEAGMEDGLKQCNNRLSEGILGFTAFVSWTCWDEGPIFAWVFNFKPTEHDKGSCSQDKHEAPATCDSPCVLNSTQHGPCPVQWDKSTDYALRYCSNGKLL